MLVVVFALVLSGAAMAGNTANQTVSFEVSPIHELSVSGNPGALVVDHANPGQQPAEVTDTSTTYALTTNGSNCVITGQLDSAMPNYVALSIRLQAPTDGGSRGYVALETVPQELAYGITRLADSGKTITYALDASTAARIIGGASRTVTLTLTDEVD